MSTVPQTPDSVEGARAVYARLARHAHTMHGEHGARRFLDLGAGNALLLIHGGHGGWYHWMRNVEPLARHARVIAPDLPGFGQSETPPGEFSLAMLAEALFALLERLNIDQVDIAGFSFGACVAAHMAALRPERVRALAIVNPAGMGPVSARLADAQTLAAQAARTEGLESGVRASLAHIMLSDAALVTPELCALAARHVKATRVQTRPIARTNPTRALLERVQAPLWLALGERDPHQAHALRERSDFAEALAPRNRVTVHAAAHWLQYEAADAFNAGLCDFLAHTRYAAAPFSL